jgi:UDP-N-acetylglucosamine pyrophosphorylase
MALVSLVVIVHVYMCAYLFTLTFVCVQFVRSIKTARTFYEKVTCHSFPYTHSPDESYVTSTVLMKNYASLVNIEAFNESCYPRLNRETLLPIPTAYGVDAETLEMCYPHGHGDLYESMYNSGRVDRYIQEGREYFFVSNIDNLGATVDLPILHFLLRSLKSNKPCEFVMEVRFSFSYLFVCT